MSDPAAAATGPYTKESSAAATRLGSGFLLWLTGLAGSLLGDAVLYFALGWVASSFGGGSAGAVLTAVIVPRSVLLLFGGAIADRRGARQVMMAGDAVMILVTLTAALVSAGHHASVWLLIAIALCVGTVDAFYLPASSSMPRRLVADQAVPRALAARQVVGRVVALCGAPIGGFVVGLSGLDGALLLDAVTFTLMLVVLFFVRVPGRIEQTPEKGIFQEMGRGVRLVAQEPLLRATMALIAVSAGLLLPVTALMVPLLARQAHWDARTAGLVIGAFSASSVLVAVVALSRGTARRTGLCSALGLLIAGLGVGLLALTGSLVVCVAGSTVAGLGTGLFSTHIGPLVLRSAPEAYMSRVQSINILVQTLPLVVSNNLLGFWSDFAGARQTTLICAVVTVAAGIHGCLSPTLRSVTFD
ncbi:MFS transporter [Streptomyces sp. NBC_01497]|uniref:MFS transporter n=1 Tax=Streptomyces sp. NBC_01497 TaxID=2903885 RepID=UPI002E3693F5|nr:MFS transporter [Streptomyces sp. NBC_01497]